MLGEEPLNACSDRGVGPRQLRADQRRGLGGEGAVLGVSAVAVAIIG